MAFADLIERANRAVQRHVMTDVAVLDNVQVNGAFRNTYDVSMGVIGVQRPSFTLPSSACAAIEPGTSHLRIPGVGSYTVQEVEPDGTGVSTLRLHLMQVEAA